MNLVRKFIGPKSKYVGDIPYAYEARIKIVENSDDYNSYLADTICALVKYLDENGITSEEVELYEIFENEEKPLNINYCRTQDGRWLTRLELCESFKTHYPGHIDAMGCTFEDREHEVKGP